MGWAPYDSTWDMQVVTPFTRHALYIDRWTVWGLHVMVVLPLGEILQE